MASDCVLFTRRCRVFVLVIAMLPAFACDRYRARHEVQRNEYFTQIVQRVDRRWIGNDRFFENTLLSNPYPEVRRWSAIALGRIGSPRGLPPLYRAIQEGDASVRAAAAFAIGEILDRDVAAEWSLSPDPKAIPLLRSMLDDPSLPVQMRAVEALGKIGTPAEAAEIVRKLERLPHNGSGSPAERAYLGFAITALARLGDPAAEPVLERLAKTASPEFQSRASEALVRLRKKTALTLPTRDQSHAKPDISNSPASLRKFGMLSGNDDPGPVESSSSELVARTLAASRKTSTIAIVQTTRGTLEVELFREEAPVTVASFVVAAKQGNSSFAKPDSGQQQRSGFVFEKVVPSQRIEGDLAGPQVGFGWTLNGEINMRPFERGSVGIAVEGGNPVRRRLFIALSPQPFLDGVHTCIGRVTSGMPVADKILAGDKILHITIRETVSFLDYIRY